MGLYSTQLNKIFHLLMTLCCWRQVHILLVRAPARVKALAQDRADQKLRAEQELVVHLPRRLILGIMEHQVAHHRPALLGGLLEELLSVECERLEALRESHEMRDR